MKLCIFGLWHLGSVTAACLAQSGHDVVGLDDNDRVLSGLNAAKAPLFEPGLDDLIRQGLDTGRLRFTADRSACADADVLWVTFDTPVDDNDRPDTEFVASRIRALLPYLRDDALVLVSSQMPVGSIARLEKGWRDANPDSALVFACSPENLRLGHAIAAFTQQARIVVGMRRDRGREILEPLLQPYCENLIWMSIESAEMSKHAINAFLGMSVAFSNELATICEKTGANAFEVEQALKSEPRIGSKAYVRPGSAFAGGTLARDIAFLAGLSDEFAFNTPIIQGILPSNSTHRLWPLRRALEALGPTPSGKTVAVLGLSYKPNTDALRRSIAIETIRELLAAGVDIRAYDPVVRHLPDALAKVRICASAAEAAAGADALVVATSWKQFSSLSPADILPHLKTKTIIDQDRVLGSEFPVAPGIRYVTLGMPT